MLDPVHPNSLDVLKSQRSISISKPSSRSDCYTVCYLSYPGILLACEGWTLPDHAKVVDKSPDSQYDEQSVDVS